MKKIAENRYAYTTNEESWKLDDEMKTAGYTKTNDCYWAQVYTNAEGAEVYAVRMDEGEYNSAEEYAHEAVEATTSEASPIDHIRAAIENEPTRGAWSKGVKMYAAELLDELEEATKGGYFAAENITDRAALKAQLLNGARDWTEYSEGGSALIYDGDIAERLCSPSEYKRSREGEHRPNCNEEWLDVQARALSRAANMIMRLARD